MAVDYATRLAVDLRLLRVSNVEVLMDKQKATLIGLSA